MMRMNLQDLFKKEKERNKYMIGRISISWN